MINLFKFALVIVRIIICYNVLSLLYFNVKGYDEETMHKFIWWGVFLIFDVWLQVVIPSSPYNKDKEN